jgi:Fe-S cluster assembly iron-binding protein IscA
MIGVTERAKQELKRILTTNTDKPEACLRLISNEQGQLGLAIDVEKEDDQAVEHEDSKVLLVEKDLADTLQGSTIDVEDTPEGARLAISRSSES